MDVLRGRPQVRRLSPRPDPGRAGPGSGWGHGDRSPAVSTTRAVRRKLDLDRPVEPAVLEECLNLALQAPTPGNAQAWRWLVVRDQGVKDRLGALFREVGEAYLAERAKCRARRGRWRPGGT